jgi:hypothetical protein
MRSLRCGLAATLSLCLLLGWSRPARAADDDGLQQAGTMMWVITVAELALLVTVAGLAGVAALDEAIGGSGNTGRLFGSDLGLGIIGTPLILGIGAGYGSMEGDWDPRVAGALHQGLWTGSALAAWGYVLGQRWQLAQPEMTSTSPWPTVAAALGLGLAGIAGGAAVGGLLVDSETEVWLVYGAPLIAGLAGVGAWIVCAVGAETGALPPADELEMTTAIIAAASAPLLLAALGVGAVSVVQALE